MKLALAQIHPVVTQISHNRDKILKFIRKAHSQKASLVIFPELALSGYPPLDFLYQKTFLKKLKQAISQIHKLMPPGTAALVGSPYGPINSKPFNAAVLLKKNRPIKIFTKQNLPDYTVFEENRFFQTTREQSNTFTFQNRNIKVLICEDLWQAPEREKGVDMIISIHASPFDLQKQQMRKKQALKWVKAHQCPLLYVNLTGEEEELIFDGSSFVLNPRGQNIHQSPGLKEDLSVLDLEGPHKILKTQTTALSLKEVLTFGLKEFVFRQGFKKVHLGLSGGIDSTVAAHLACEAFPPRNVHLFFLPGPFTSPVSFKAALKTAQNLGCPFSQKSITPLYKKCLKTRAFTSSLSRQNLQARLRNLYLSAYANQNPSLLIGTSNKTELALGYATLYGDMTGALLPLGDLWKTEIYSLAREFVSPPVLPLIVKRPPSAELKSRQKDSIDLKSPYPPLDKALKKLVEQNKSPTTSLEKRLFQKILTSEFKRKQAPPLLKVKALSFDRGWKRPLCPKTNFDKKSFF